MGAAWWKDGGWTERHLPGHKQGGLRAEVFAILRAVRLLSERNETGQAYTVFSDSQAAVARIRHDDCGPAQALAGAVVETSYEPRQRGCSFSVRWAATHRGIEGNEHVDALAKRAAGGEEGRADPDNLGEASLFHLTKKTTEAQSKTTSE